MDEEDTNIEDNQIEEEVEEISEPEAEEIILSDEGERVESAMLDNSIVEERYDPMIGRLKPQELVYEMETSYLNYAMSVIVSRALPDVRDGLKPVHRRVLYAMHETGLRHNTRYRKCAAVVGEVLKSYHPHGDIAVYDTLVRMAQNFSMRYMLVDGQGNFGSMDGDSAAAMRYTECRMSSIAEEMLQDIDKDTVDWIDNYDGSTQEPVVLPARIPQLLLNGTMGIAVGMATNIPPHNLTELCNGTIHLIDNPDASIDDLMEHVKGPDFPTGGIIYNTEDMKTAFATGKGKIVMRAKTEIEEAKRGFRIIITEIPYQVNKSSLIEKIADLVKEKRIDGISDLRDESDRRGVRVVIELKNNSYPKKVLNRLFELTQMQTAFHVNMLALTPDMEPQVMTLKDVLGYYIEHRQIVITRRTKFELKKAEDRAHILEGLKIALDHIDEVISTIRASANRDEAKKNLIAKFELSEKQADAILEMRLSALAALERQKIEEEYNELLKRIAYFRDLLEHPEKVLGLIKDDLNDVIEKYGDARRTQIIPHALGDFSAEDLIPDEQVIVAFTRGNYIKRQEIDTYRRQTRGGVGIVGMTTKEEDIVDFLASARTHDDIFFFTNKGRVFKSKVYELPSTSRQSKGTPIVNIIQISQDEKVTAILTSSKDDKSTYFVMGTKLGQIKKTEIEKYDNIRKTGIIAMGLRDKDELKWVKTSNAKDIIVEVSEKGQAICYNEEDARPMGRSAGGVTGMKLRGGDEVMSMDVVPGNVWPYAIDKKNPVEPDMLIVLENGFGKRTMIKHFHIQKRGGMGIRAASCTAKTGNVIGMHIVYDDKADVVLASRKGQFIRMDLDKIKRLGRDTQGVTLMRLREGDKVSSVALILPEEDEAANNQQTQMPLDQPEAQADSPKPTQPKSKELKKPVPKLEPAPAIKQKVAEKKPGAELKKKVSDFANFAIEEVAAEKKEKKAEESKKIDAYNKPNLNVKFYNNNIVVDKDDAGSEKK
ncbi:MAG: DNA gyrase subunit A [Candidatus Berkelbacteria bacterium]|nr:DNA gyrase subunit A [Candidatus Berkelbacteria bacterium]